MHIKRWLVSILFIFAIIASLGFVKFKQVQAAIAFGESFPEPSGSVKSTLVEMKETSDEYRVVGEVKAKKSLTLTTEYAGPVEFVGFTPGQNVDKGQVLLKQDIKIETANLKAAKARLKLTKSAFERQSALLKESRTSQNDVDVAEANMAVAAAEVENLSSVIDKKTIIAPFDGYVGLEDFQPGQMLQANSVITRLIGRTETIWVDFALPQTVSQPSIGDKVLIQVIGQTSTPLHAEIVAQEPSVNASSRQQIYRAEVANTERVLSPQQIVSVIVNGAAKTQAVVPANAVYRNHTGDYVYQLNQDEKKNWRAQPVKVVLGQRKGDEQIIQSGLEGGEFIATEGAFKLSEGLLVYTQTPEHLGGNGK